MNFGNISFGLASRGSIKRSENLHGFIVARLCFQDSFKTLSRILGISAVNIRLAQSEVRQNKIW